MFQHTKPVTICDQFLFLLICELKSKVFRETFNVSLYCLIKDFCFNFIKVCQIPIKHYMLVSKVEYTVFNCYYRPVTICDWFQERTIILCYPIILTIR